MKTTIPLTIILFLYVLSGTGQEKQFLSLGNVIGIASQQSLDAFRNENMYLSSYWEFRYFKADRRPTLSLDATPINYNRSMQKVYNYDENRDEFISREFLDSEVALLINQNVGLTGGRFFAR